MAGASPEPSLKVKIEATNDVSPGAFKMSTIEEILNAARALDPEEQLELRRRLDLLTSSEENGISGAEAGEEQDHEALHKRIHLALYEAGLVTDINPPSRKKRERRPPIRIKGKPLSETIIEDRR